MRVLICGVDGYLGWPLALYLAHRGHEIAGIDDYMRRRWVDEVGSHSATPIRSMPERSEAFREHVGRPLIFRHGDICESNVVRDMLESFRPDTIVHLAEQPSAAYSMIDLKHCTFTQTNNIVGTLNLLHEMRDASPTAHLVKLGTMGEYGTPNVDIPEGFFDIEYRGRKARLPFPRQATSWYHQSKVHDSHNIMMACKLWGLRSTDVMQGVVYGTRIDEMRDDDRLLSRFDFDQCFGTVINRFCAQAVIGEPITPYGKGHQKRGFLPLRDAVQCLGIAIEHPPEAGAYRVFNQFEQVYDVTQLAARVKAAADSFGLHAVIRNVDNPRSELEEHYYNPDHAQLLSLGYRPTADMATELKTALADLFRYKDRLRARREALIPDIRWDGRRRRSDYLLEPDADASPSAGILR